MKRFRATFVNKTQSLLDEVESHFEVTAETYQDALEHFKALPRNEASFFLCHVEEI